MPNKFRDVQNEIEQSLRAFRFVGSDINAIKIALEEALVNAVKHGNQMDRLKRVHVRYQITIHRFEVHVSDEGKGFDPSEVPDPCAAEYLERDSRRGLALMRHFMKEVHFDAPGNCVRMTKARSGLPQCCGVWVARDEPDKVLAQPGPFDADWGRDDDGDFYVLDGQQPVHRGRDNDDRGKRCGRKPGFLSNLFNMRERSQPCQQ